MPTPAPCAVLLRFDGIVHTSDLPTQAFARHLAEALPAEQNAQLIGGMRGFLEGKPDLIPPGVDLSGAEDGDQAVEILARAAGLTPPVIGQARSQARRDLAASVWAVDAADGLDELLAATHGAYLAVLAGPDDPAAAALLASEEISVDELIRAPIGTAIESLGSRAERSAITVIGTRWAGELELAQDAGCGTVLVDRCSTGRGTPAVRCSNLREAAEAVSAQIAGELTTLPQLAAETRPRTEP